MKRATSMLGALALMAIGFLFAPAAAQAACTAYPSPPVSDSPVSQINNWPRTKEKNSNPAHATLYYCGTGNPATDNEFNVAWLAAQKIGQKGQLLTGNVRYIANTFYNQKIRVYFYEDLAALNASWNTNYNSQDAGGTIYGVTLRVGDSSSPNVPINSFGVWRKDSSGNINSSNSIKGAVYHELGHVFDKIHGYPSGYQPGQWGAAKFDDINTLNTTKTRAQAFTGITINPNCTGKYNDTVNYTNYDVALCQWPYFLNQEELFANVFGKRLGNLLSDGTTQPQLTIFSNWLTQKFAVEMNKYMDDIGKPGWTTP